MAHKPGPWMMNDGVICDKDGYGIARPIEGSRAGNSENIPLIEAAPDMLEALRIALMQINGCIEDHKKTRDKAPRYFEVAERIADAIAKAEGRS